MSETERTKEFIKDQIKRFGKKIYIEKVMRSDKNGEPDVVAVFQGMPVYMEAKLINSISGINIHPFSDIQLDILKDRAKAGAVSIGLLHCKNCTKFIFYDKLTTFLTREDVEKAEEFNWQTLWCHWMKNILTNSSSDQIKMFQSFVGQQ